MTDRLITENYEGAATGTEFKSDSYGLSRLKSRMSERLITVADMLGGCVGKDGGMERHFECTADVGCDHGYISMYLALAGISDRGIAMDVREGPLSAAEGNIRSSSLADRISTRLSDGLTNLSPGEADSVVIAGMGGRVITRILADSDLNGLGIKMGVLQPQSEIYDFRKFLHERNFFIEDERVVFDDGKYYFPMLVDFRGSQKYVSDRSKAAEAFEGCTSPQIKVLSRIMESKEKLQDLLSDEDEAFSSERLARDLSYRFGAHNIIRRDPLLVRYLEHGREVSESILMRLNRDEHPDRYDEAEKELREIKVCLRLL
ncbi:MAG: SAM-dependent methyltransferase [Butyrivibrio sp.]|nr:SAM-dependent methyltransferase [Butyrivibrio sp.]